MLVTDASKRHYDDAPLEEAIFELFVPPSGPWSPTQGEELATQLTSYSGQREDLEDVNVFFRLGPGKSVAQGVNPGARRLRLWNAEQTRAVQFGAEMCTHNVRRPYGHFEDHLDAIRELFGAYLAVMKPQQLGWVGQRYLNIVKLPPDSSPSDYFEMYPHLPPQLPQAHRPFAVQVETASFEQGSTIVNLALLEFTPEAAVYTIDIYARSDETVPLDLDCLMAWQSRAHASIGLHQQVLRVDHHRRSTQALQGGQMPPVALPTDTQLMNVPSPPAMVRFWSPSGSTTVAAVSTVPTLTLVAEAELHLVRLHVEPASGAGVRAEIRVGVPLHFRAGPGDFVLDQDEE